MLISVESFADMIKISPGEILYSLKTNRKVNGLELPKPVYSKASHTKPMFNLADVVTFEKKLNVE
jgi:hypothetical protein